MSGLENVRLNDAIEQLYRVFKAKNPKTFYACDCCLSADEVAVMLKTPLRQLSADQMSSYTISVFLTSGSEEDFRYFLPRILEISIFERDWWPSREVVLGKLALANWLSWDQSEIDAIRALFVAVFDMALVADEDLANLVDEWICGLGLAGENLVPYLQKLERASNWNALYGFFELNSLQLQKGRLGNSFWGEHKQLAQPVIDWFESAPIQAIIWKHYGVD